MTFPQGFFPAARRSLFLTSHKRRVAFSEELFFVCFSHICGEQFWLSYWYFCFHFWRFRLRNGLVIEISATIFPSFFEIWINLHRTVKIASSFTFLPAQYWILTQLVLDLWQHQLAGWLAELLNYGSSTPGFTSLSFSCMKISLETTSGRSISCPLRDQITRSYEWSWSWDQRNRNENQKLFPRAAFEENPTNDVRRENASVAESARKRIEKRWRFLANGRRHSRSERKWISPKILPMSWEHFSWENFRQVLRGFSRRSRRERVDFLAQTYVFVDG